MNANIRSNNYPDYARQIMNIEPHITSPDKLTPEEDIVLSEFYGALFCMEFAKCFVVEFEGHLRNSNCGLYKFTAKTASSKAVDLCRDFESIIQDGISSANAMYYCDMTQYMEDDVRPKFERLKEMVFRIVAPRFGVYPDNRTTAPEKMQQRAILAAETETVRILCDMTQREIEKTIEKRANFQGNVLRGLVGLGFDKILHEMESVKAAILGNLDISKDIRIYSAKMDIRNALCNRERMKRAVDVAEEEDKKTYES